MSEQQTIAPQPGPQFEFLTSQADIAIFGGAAGGGKSYALLLEAVRWSGVPGFAGVLFRRTYPELIGGGSVWEKARELYSGIEGAVGRELPHLDWRFESGAAVEFRHLQHAKDVYSHQGKEYCLIGFDELTHFREAQFWYLLSRNRSTCGVRPYVRATTNPDCDSWVRDFIDWWIDDETGLPIPERSGKLRYFVRDGDDLIWADGPAQLEHDYPHLTRGPGGVHIPPKSVTFIAARLEDNPKLTEADPGYRASLLALQRVERQRLLDGNWNARAGKGQYFQRNWFPVAEHAPVERCVRVRGWDFAATEVSETNRDPDWTRGVRLARNAQGHAFVEDVVGVRGTPGTVESLLENTTRQDGPAVTQVFRIDPAAAGKGWMATLERIVLEAGGRCVLLPVPRNRKEEYAKPVSSAAEPGEGKAFGDISIVAAEWNSAFLAELEAFPDGTHDDQVDAIAAAWNELPEVQTSLNIATPSSIQRAREASQGGSERRRKATRRRGKWDGL